MIRRYRQQRGLTQAAFAGLVGVEQATVSRWERGGHNPDLAMQHRLRDLIGRPDRISDRLIAHRTQVAIRPMSLRRASGELVAASASARLVLARLPVDPLQASPESDAVLRQWALAVREGFFDGAIASVQGAGSWEPAGGGPICRGTWVWSPVTTGDGEVLLSSQFQVDAQGGALTEVVTERCTIVTMDELVIG